MMTSQMNSCFELLDLENVWHAIDYITFRHIANTQTITYRRGWYAVDGLSHCYHKFARHRRVKIAASSMIVNGLSPCFTLHTVTPYYPTLAQILMGGFVIGKKVSIYVSIGFICEETNMALIFLISFKDSFITSG